MPRGLSVLLRPAFVTLLAVMVVWPLPPARAERTVASPDTIRLMVELKDPRSLEEIRGLRDVRRISNRAPRLYLGEGRVRRAADLRRWRLIEVSAREVQALQEQLRSNPAVVSVREEHVYEAALVPTDTEFIEQTGLHTEAWPLDINAPEAWDITTGSGTTVIAVLDGGVDLEHEDLRDKIWVNSDEIADNDIDDDGNGYVDDVHGWDVVANQDAGIAVHHATHVAGIAAASSNNGIGVAGVDWGARIMSVRVLSSSGLGGEAGIIEGIEYAVANGADVINLSIAGPSSEALVDAVENAYAAGVVVVAAVGNSGLNTGQFQVMPGCADRDGVNLVLGVGALDDEGEPATFSNYGECLDVVAPGQRILSTRVGDRYGAMTGTSMSSPFAAGVAGLYLALRPDASPAEVINAIAGSRTAFAGEDAVEWNTFYKGRLDAAAALGVSPGGSSSSSPDDSQSGSGDGGGSSGGASGGGSGGGGGGGGDSGGGGGSGDGERERVSAPKKPAVHPQANLALLSRTKDTFRFVFGRVPSTLERTYWDARIKRAEKRSYSALLGAMLWHKAQGKTYDATHPAIAGKTSGSVAGTRTSSLIPHINRLHRITYGRNPSPSEHTYWLGRISRGEKTTEDALLGAMLFHRLTNIAH